MKRKQPPKKTEQPSRPMQPTIANAVQIRHLKKVLLVIIALFAVVLYANTLGNGYAVDDGTVMENNKIVKKGVSAIPEIFATRYREGFWERKENLYRPLSLVMFAAEWQIAPNNPFPGHLVNVLLYALTGILLFNTLVRLLPKHNYLIPFIATLLFIAHPIHTEVVANIKSRDEILCFLFSIASINLLMRYLDKNKTVALLCACICFLLALLSKESAITLVVVIPLVMYFFTKSSSKKIISATSIFGVTAALYLLIRGSVLGSLSNETEIQVINNSLLGAPDFITRFASSMSIMGKYLLLLIFPHPLVFDYSFNQVKNVPITDFKALLSLMVWIALFIYAVKGIRKKELKSFGILFFLITISLVSNVVFLIESTLAERFLYMPSLGFCLAVSVLIISILKSNVSQVLSSFSYMLKKNTALFTVVAVVLILFSIKTISRNTCWKENLVLLENDVKLSPESARIRYAYGSALLIEKALKEKDEPLKQNYLDKAIVQLEKGVSILNTYADAFYHLGLAYKEKKDYANAIKNFESARKSKTFPTSDFYISSGVAYGSAGRYPEAVADLKKAMEIDPKSFDAHNNLGIYYTDMGQIENAVSVLENASSLAPEKESVPYNIGNAYAKAGNYNKAIEYYLKATKINDKYEDAYNNIGNCYAAMKDYQAAIPYFKKVIELNPNNQKVLNNIGVTYKILGDDANGDKYLRLANPQK